MVLPFVPVIPTMSSFVAGSPWTATAMWAIASRVSVTTIWGTSSSRGRSTSSATAPRSTASAAWSCPSWRAPTKQANNEPDVTSRES